MSYKRLADRILAPAIAVPSRRTAVPRRIFNRRRLKTAGRTGCTTVVMQRYLIGQNIDRLSSCVKLSVTTDTRPVDRGSSAVP